MYEIVIDKYAEKQLAKIPPPDFNRITKAIKSLSQNPSWKDIKNWYQDLDTELELVTIELFILLKIKY